MSRSAASRVRSRLGGAASLALAIVVNVMAVTLLAVSTKRPLVLYATPPIQLQLLPPLHPAIRRDSRATSEQRRPPAMSRAVISRSNLGSTTPVPVQGAATAVQAAGPSVTGGEPTADLGRIFRANLGCSDPSGLRLTADERARCAQKLGQGARQAAVLQTPIDPGKRAWFDAAHAAYALNPDPMDGATPVFGCAVRFGGPHKKFKPPHSLKVPGLPCYLIPPRGKLTEESAVAPPEHVESR